VALGKGSDKLLLSKVAHSKTNPNQVYVANQEGHIYVLDRKHNYRVVRKLVGNRGTIRALTSVVGDSAQGPVELVVSGGCDRHVRLFDPNCDL
jgi:hypothetical protein